jgi:hypothetical protein
MGRPKTGVNAEDRIKLVNQVLSQLYKFFIGGKRH